MRQVILPPTNPFSLRLLKQASILKVEYSLLIVASGVFILLGRLAGERVGENPLVVILLGITTFFICTRFLSHYYGFDDRGYFVRWKQLFVYERTLDVAIATTGALLIVFVLNPTVWFILGMVLYALNIQRCRLMLRRRQLVSSRKTLPLGYSHENIPTSQELQLLHGWIRSNITYMIAWLLGLLVTTPMAMTLADWVAQDPSRIIASWAIGILLITASRYALRMFFPTLYRK